MSAIITDQFRILNAKNFLSSISSTQDSYYTFVGLPNPSEVSSNWDSDPPSHKDSFNDENICWETMISLYVSILMFSVSIVNALGIITSNNGLPMYFLSKKICC